jgi:hypothetical protein
MRERARAGARLNSQVGVQACASCGDISSDHRCYYNDSTPSAHLVALGLHIKPFKMLAKEVMVCVQSKTGDLNLPSLGLFTISFN